MSGKEMAEINGLAGLLLYQGVRDYAETNNRLSDKASEVAGRLFEVVEGRASISEVVVDEDTRMIVGLGAEWARLRHDLPRAEIENLVEKLPEVSGAIGYGNNWRSKRREAIIRDSARCQECGMTERAHHEEYGAGLHVHHKTPLREFYTPEEANQLSNLKTVCTVCHADLEAQE